MNCTSSLRLTRSNASQVCSVSLTDNAALKARNSDWSSSRLAICGYSHHHSHPNKRDDVRSTRCCRCCLHDIDRDPKTAEAARQDIVSSLQGIQWSSPHGNLVLDIAILLVSCCTSHRGISISAVSLKGNVQRLQRGQIKGCTPRMSIL